MHRGLKEEERRATEEGEMKGEKQRRGEDEISCPIPLPRSLP